MNLFFLHNTHPITELGKNEWFDSQSTTINNNEHQFLYPEAKKSRNLNFSEKLQFTALT